MFLLIFLFLLFLVFFRNSSDTNIILKFSTLLVNFRVKALGTSNQDILASYYYIKLFPVLIHANSLLLNKNSPISILWFIPALRLLF